MRHLLLLLVLTALPCLAQNEYMSWNDLSVSQKIPMTISRKEFDKKYGGKYELADPMPYETCKFGDESIRVVDYKGARYEIVGDNLEFRSIDFSQRRNLYMQFKDDWFDHTTTLKYFEKAYPLTAEMAEETTDKDGVVREMLTFYPEDKNAPYEWRLYFVNGKLDFMECFLYCL